MCVLPILSRAPTASPPSAPPCTVHVPTSSWYLLFWSFLILTRPHAYPPHPHLTHTSLGRASASSSRRRYPRCPPPLPPTLLPHAPLSRRSLVVSRPQHRPCPLPPSSSPLLQLLSCYPTTEPPTSTSTPQLLLLMSHGHPQPSLMGYGMPMGMGPDFFSQVRLFESLVEHPGALTP